MDYEIRWLIRRDVKPAVACIEIESPAYWSEDELVLALRQRNQIGRVYCVRGAVVGFVVYRLSHRRYDVLNIGTHPAFRRCGIGSALIGFVASKLSETRRHRIDCAVDESCVPAQLFFRSCGFRCNEIERDAVVGDQYLFQFFHDATVTISG